MKNKISILLVFLSLFFISCIVPTITVYEVDFKKNTLTIRYSDFYADTDTLHFADSLGFKKYTISEKRYYGYAAMLNNQITISDSVYLEEYHKYHPGIDYKILDKTFKKEKGNLSIEIKIGMKYDSLTEDVKVSVLSDLFDDVYVVDNEILLFMEKDEYSIAGNGKTRKSNKNHILSWDLSNSKFVIKKKTILDDYKYNDFLKLFNNDGTLKKDRVPALFIDHFEGMND